MRAGYLVFIMGSYQHMPLRSWFYIYSMFTTIVLLVLLRLSHLQFTNLPFIQKYLDLLFTMNLVIVLTQVLYRFLEQFSKFDWDCYGVSLWGPLELMSLPDVIGKK